MTINRLYKSSTNKMLFGVCGGLAEYFNVDPVLMRVAFVVLALANGIGLLVYIILAIVTPQEESVKDREPGEGEGQVVDATPETEDARRPPRNPGASLARRRNGLALILIALGLLLLMVNLDLFWWLNWSTFWPLLLIAAGAAILLNRFRRT
jgi:phage shock protein C